MSHESSSKPDNTRSVTKDLCSWINQLSLNDIPEEVQSRAKYLILDGIGCALVGAHLPWTEKAADAIFEIESPGNCLVWGYDKVCLLDNLDRHQCTVR
jgi:aconitate decarboxylase